MKILVTGSTGFVGSAVVSKLKAKKHDVVRLVRPQSSSTFEEPTVRWDPGVGTIEKEGLRDLDGVVHLAGENISTGRWTAAKKSRIRGSRVKGTHILAEALAELEKPPKVLVSTSAIGYYGDRGGEILTESSPSGKDFLSEVSRDWEGATEPVKKKGVRVVLLRLGVVLSTRGGALAKMLTPFRFGLGGRIGDGKQYMSWITLDDTSGVVMRALEDGSLNGPVNVVTPNPVTNREFTRTLGRVLSRPTPFPMPGFVARVLFGEMADALLLSSSRVEPEALKKAAHAFQSPELEAALRGILKG